MVKGSEIHRVLGVRRRRRYEGDKFRQMTAERERGAEGFAKTIFGPFHISGEHRGFTVFETDDPDKLANISIFYTPEMRWNFLLINDSSKLRAPLEDEEIA